MTSALRKRTRKAMQPNCNKNAKLNTGEKKPIGDQMDASAIHGLREELQRLRQEVESFKQELSRLQLQPGGHAYAMFVAQLDMRGIPLPPIPSTAELLAVQKYQADLRQWEQEGNETLLLKLQPQMASAETKGALNASQLAAFKQLFTTIIMHGRPQPPPLSPAYVAFLRAVARGLAGEGEGALSTAPPGSGA